MDDLTVFVAYTNSDLTEGKGTDIPIAVCKLESTAKRLANKRYVQGSNGPVRKIDLKWIDGHWYGKSNDCFLITYPTREDEKAQELQDKRTTIIQRIKATGVSDDDLKLIGVY